MNLKYENYVQKKKDYEEELKKNQNLLNQNEEDCHTYEGQIKKCNTCFILSFVVGTLCIIGVPFSTIELLSVILGVFFASSLMVSIVSFLMKGNDKKYYLSLNTKPNSFKIEFFS